MYGRGRLAKHRKLDTEKEARQEHQPHALQVSRQFAGFPPEAAHRASPMPCGYNIKSLAPATQGNPRICERGTTSLDSRHATYVALANIMTPPNHVQRLGISEKKRIADDRRPDELEEIKRHQDVDFRFLQALIEKKLSCLSPRFRRLQHSPRIPKVGHCQINVAINKFIGANSTTE